MSVFTCNSKKENFKNLTIGQRYTGVELDNNIVEITNDSGSIARYAKRYFTEVEVRTRPTPIPNMSIDEYIENHIEIEHEYGNGHNVICDLNINIHTTYTNAQLLRSSISCGILELEGLEHIINAISEIRKNIEEDTSIRVTPFEDSHLFYVILKHILNYVNNHWASAFIICSTFEPERPVLNEFNKTVMAEDGQGISSGIVNNPNSENDIKVWVIDIANFLNN